YSAPVPRLSGVPRLFFSHPPCSLGPRWWPALRMGPMGDGTSDGCPFSALIDPSRIPMKIGNDVRATDDHDMGSLTSGPLALRILAAAASSILLLVMVTGRTEPSQGVSIENLENVLRERPCRQTLLCGKE